MDDDRTLDRRSFLAGVSATGLAGFAGLGSLRSRAGRDGDVGLVGNQDGDGGEGNRTGGQGGGGQDGGQDDGIDFFRAVVPASDLLEPSPVNKIVVAGGPIQPGVRPPPLCFPQGVDQWFARDAVLVKPTETTGLFDRDEPIGTVERTRAHLERAVEPGTVYRVTGGEYCDGYVRVTVHELPPRLSEYFSVEMLDRLDESFPGVGNGTAGNETAPNGTATNVTAEGRTAGNRSRNGSPVGSTGERNE